MTITCTSFRSTVLPSNRIQLHIEDGQHDAAEEKLSIKEIASLLSSSASTIYRLSTRKRNPLPLVRGKGRPYGLRSHINNWLATADRARNFSIDLKTFGL